MAAGVSAADTYALADGTSYSGDIVKFDDIGVMIHTSSDVYTNVAWPQFSQDTLKQLADNPKYKPLVEWFIEPTEHPAKPRVSVHYEQPVQLPAQPSLLGGMIHSSLGLFILLLVYAANLYAAFEVALVRGKSIPLVVGAAAVLPIIGQVIFMLQPVKGEQTVEEIPLEEGMPGAPAADAPPPGSDIQIVSASWQPGQEVPEEKKLQPQVFARGKYTFNKRFIETKFANFIGELKGEATIYSMEIKTLKDTLAVEGIKQVGASEVILETPTGQLTVTFGDIQEIKLIPRPA
jgi:hypothetical protein